MKKIYVWLLIYFVSPLSLIGQSDSLNSSQYSLPETQIPPVAILLQAAVQNNPARRYQELRRQELLSMAKTNRRQWTKYISFDANYRWGQMGVIGTTATTIVAPVNTSSTQMQNWFQVGVSFNLPLLEIVDARNRKRRDKIIIQQAEAEADRMGEEIQQKVIEYYNKALMHLAVMKTKKEAMDINSVQVQMSEQNFIKRKIDIIELTRLKQLQVQAIIDYEASKAEFRSSLMTLELYTGLKILNK